MNRRLFAAVFVLVGGMAFALRGNGTPATEQELMQADRAFDAATAQKGIDGLLGFIADDMTTIRPNEPIVRGKDAFGAGWKDLLSTPGLTLRWKPELASASQSVDLGYTVGSYEITTKDAGGVPHLTGSGKYITIWRRQADGAWKVVFDSGVEDRLAPAAKP